MKPTPFQLEKARLEAGVTLLEASAGTGKTYTISGLVLRLLLERRLPIEEILVVTFTEAATAELRTRIRNLLVEARAALQGGAFQEPWLDRYAHAPAETRAAWRQQTQAAIESFDEAPVFTLHGFCRRVLWDRAFETGAWFDVELTPDVTGLLREAADGFWRRRFTAAAELEALAARAAQMSADGLFQLARSVSRALDVRVVDRAEGRDRASLVRELAQVFAEAQALWAAQRDEITRPFGLRGKWGNRPYNLETEMREHWAQFDRLFAEGQATASAAQSLPVLAASTMWEKRSKRSNQRVPAHPFFNVCDRWKRLVADYASALQAEFLALLPGEMRRLRARDKSLGFDDLLTQLRAALRGRGGEALAERLRGQYRAALIDEFQDTDSIQFEIFERIFGGGETPLYLVGDPKQAIYSFRGADVFAYLRAQQHAQRRATLGDNYRSEAPLVAAVNAVFQPPDTARPFAIEEIEFHPVQARGPAEKTPLTDAGQRLPGLHFWYWDPPTELKRPQQERRIAEAVAAEIWRLLGPSVLLGHRRIQPGDIAVLVETHAQAALLSEVLCDHRLPAVMQTQESVWQTAESHELERVLAAIAEPNREAGLRGALTTALMGLSADALDPGNQLDPLDPWRKAFADHALTWETLGFLPMFERFLRQHEIRARLLAQAGGERRLTNVLHLGELLHQVAEQRRLGPLGLREWLAQRRVAADAVAEESLLRLERDDAAVQLVTIHRSKGLEYPVVFYPFLQKRWENWSNEPTLFHDPEAEQALTLDLGGEKFAEHQERMAAERFAENIRLTYVALTRAKHRCYVTWGTTWGSDVAALGWLLHPPPQPNQWAFTELPKVSQEHVKGRNSDQRQSDLAALARRAQIGGAVAPIAIAPLPEPGSGRWRGEGPPDDALRVREFRGKIAQEWSVTSFSGLARGRGDDAADRDPALSAASVAVEPESSGLASFRGTRAGVCWHELMEGLDFSARPAELKPQAVEALRAHGFPAETLAGPLTEWVHRTLTLRLASGFSLSQIPASDRRVELEFCLPLRRITPDALTALWARHQGRGPAAARDFPRLQFRPVEGFLRGFIDLVVRRNQRFWLVDWKSNWLGPAPADYHPDRLSQAMAREHYYWQYHLYLVALDAWLRQRLPGYRYEENFGGVYYLFVRATGADPSQPELGVFHDRPSPELVEELRALLLARQG